MSTPDGPPRSAGSAGPPARPGIAGLVLHDQPFTAIDPHVVYGLLRLRVDVFVVEQACAYPELDGRDLEPTARHVWLAPPDAPDAPATYLRILDEGEGARRIGRVVTAPAHRGKGLGRRLLGWALQAHPGVIVIDAQAHLQTYYEGLGFAATGPTFVEDGIPHVTMRRTG